MKITSLVLLTGIAAVALQAGCSKPAAPLPGDSPPAATASEDGTNGAAPPVSLPAKPQKSTAEQAATLLRFIDSRPECQPYRTPLEQLSSSPPGAPVELNMAEIMDQAYKAGCQKDPG